MSDSRTTPGLGEHPGARFRCVVCQRFVKATERGVCPTCGFKPPTLTRPGRLDPRMWQRAVSKARLVEGRARRGTPPWLLVLIAAAFLAISLSLGRI